jgi:hypothetical protein
MHHNIIEPTMDYNFSKIQLGIPVSHPNSTYLARIFLDNKPVYIQTPKCITRGGIVKSGKKMYCDLMFSIDDSIFIDWITSLESKCQTLIVNKSESWFQTSYTRDEIETAFSSSLKIYKSGKFYLLRVNVKPTMKIYNDLNVDVNLDDINENTHLINIVEFYGIKFTSRNFQIELELKQSMVVSDDEFLGNCFINAPKKQEQQGQDGAKQGQQDGAKQGQQQQGQQQQGQTQTQGQQIQIQIQEQPIVPFIPREPDEPPPQQHIDNDLVVNDATLQPNTDEDDDDDSVVNEVISDDTQNDTNEVNDMNPPDIKEQFDSVELSEFDFDGLECLDEPDGTTLLHLKRPNEQYYKEYNNAISRATKLKRDLRRIYLEAQLLKEKHSLDVDDIDRTIYSDVDISDDDGDV